MPYKEQIENQVISYILTYEESADDVIEQLSTEDFYVDHNKKVFNELKSGNKNIEKIIDNLQKEDITIEDKLESILLDKARHSKLKDCIEILKDNTKYRKMIEFGEKLCDLGYDKKTVNSDDIEKFQDNIDSSCSNYEFEHLHEGIIGYIKNYDHKPRFIKSNVASLDRKFLFERGDLVAIGARPSIGKSAFQLQLAIGYAYNNNKTLCFSLEMKKEQLVQRIIANETQIKLDSIRNKNISDSEKKTLKFKLEKHFKNLQLKLVDDIYSMNGMIEAMKKEKKEHGLDVVMIDYLQLTETKGNNRNQEIGAITRTLKRVAKSLNIGIVILSQLSRGCEQRCDKRPIMSDLRDSGEIEQDLDSCIMLYRDEYYNEDTEDKNILEAIIRKQRQGELGTVHLYYDMPTQKIKDLGYGS